MTGRSCSSTAQGKILLREPITSGQAKFQRIGPQDGISVAISDQGDFAAYAFKSLLVLVHNGRLEKIRRDGITSCAVSHDGTLAVAASSGGRVEAFGPDGTVLWTINFGGAGCQVAAAGDRESLVATGDGDLVLVDSAGQQKWRTSVAKVADEAVRPIKPAAEFEPSVGPPVYREPTTLGFARQQLSAKEVSAWKPVGPAQELWGRKFYATSGPIELAAPKGSDGEYLLHLVYRRPAENRSVAVTLQDRDGKHAFDLDLPTYEYRVVDLPLRGTGATAVVSADGPVEIAECSLWSFEWPGGNLAYVKPAGAEVASKPKAANPLDDIAAELDGAPQALGEMKDCKVYFPNPDPDQIAGPYLRAPLDPIQMLDGKRFELGKLAAWAGQNPMQPPNRGAFVTIDFLKGPARASSPRMTGCSNNRKSARAWRSSPLTNSTRSPAATYSRRPATTTSSGVCSNCRKCRHNPSASTPSAARRSRLG